MDWKKEHEEMKDEVMPRFDWFNAEQGQHKIKILTEGVEFLTHPFGKPDAEKNVVKVRFEVEVDGKHLNWAVMKGKTFNSLYGQLVCLGYNWDGLVGKQITLIVKGDKKSKVYTILEALNYDRKLRACEEKEGKKELFVTE